MKKQILAALLAVSLLSCFSMKAGRFVCWTFGTVRTIADTTIDTTANAVNWVVPL